MASSLVAESRFNNNGESGPRKFIKIERNLDYERQVSVEFTLHEIYSEIFVFIADPICTCMIFIHSELRIKNTSDCITRGFTRRGNYDSYNYCIVGE